MDSEPRYVEDPFDDDLPAQYKPSRPKWMVPQNEFEIKVLHTLGMHFYPQRIVAGKPTNSKDMRSKLIEIGKSMVSLESGLDAVYPTEWVMSVLDWYRQHGRRGWTALKSFLNSLHNTQWRDDFVVEWRKDHPESRYSAPVDDRQDIAKYMRLPED
jgi:hypothetical protein